MEPEAPRHYRFILQNCCKSRKRTENAPHISELAVEAGAVTAEACHAPCHHSSKAANIATNLLDVLELMLDP
jgi:hypothetical protein